MIFPFNFTVKIHTIWQCHICILYMPDSLHWSYITWNIEMHWMTFTTPSNGTIVLMSYFYTHLHLFYILIYIIFVFFYLVLYLLCILFVLLHLTGSLNVASLPLNVVLFIIFVLPHEYLSYLGLSTKINLVLSLAVQNNWIWLIHWFIKFIIPEENW